MLSHYFRPIKANKFKIYGKAVVLSNLAFTAEDFYFKWNQARLPPPDLLDYWQQWKSESEAKFMDQLKEFQALVGATSAPAPDSFGIMMRSMYSKGSTIIRVLDMLAYVESESKSHGST
ncbi:MAG: hypothetical protein EOP04_29305 [Proteobacteria bacterium]|nr:MAG: hypothetical protein EOP04_29305 [Pseudomonadota bacterium]